MTSKYDETAFQKYFKLFKEDQRNQGSVLSGRYAQFFQEKEAEQRNALNEMQELQMN